VLYKAKMIGSLSVQFHKGDKMALDAMRDLKVMAKTSGLCFLPPQSYWSMF